MKLQSLCILVLAFMMFVGGATARTSGQNIPKNMLQSCGNGCSSCISGTCYECDPGYYMNSSYCSPCSSTCNECTSSSNCTFCSIGYKLKNGDCVSDDNADFLIPIFIGAGAGCFLLICISVCICRKMAQRRAGNTGSEYHATIIPVLVVTRTKAPEPTPPTFDSTYKQQHQYRSE